jgi:hypothetical protein
MLRLNEMTREANVTPYDERRENPTAWKQRIAALQVHYAKARGEIFRSGSGRRPRRMVHGKNVATGEQRSWLGCAACAKEIGVADSTVAVAAYRGRPANGWLLSYGKVGQSLGASQPL